MPAAAGFFDAGFFDDVRLRAARASVAKKFPLINTLAPVIEHGLGIQMPPGLMSNLELIVFGALIIFFLVVEPHGLARLWQIGKEKLRLWPFPH